jgi:hypothetical protein
MHEMTDPNQAVEGYAAKRRAPHRRRSARREHMKISGPVLMMSVLLLAGCGERQPRVDRLTGDLIRKEMNESKTALQAKDWRRVIRNVAPHWQMTLTVESAGKRQTHVLDRRSYRDLLKTTLREGEYLSVSLTNVVIEISPDGQRASVSSEVHQDILYRGHVIKSRGVQTNTIEIINGFAMDVRAEGFTRQTIDAEPEN